MIYFFVASFSLGILIAEFLGAHWGVAAFSVLVSLAIFAVLKNERGKIVFFCSLFLAAGILRMNYVQVPPNSDVLNLVGQNISFEAEVVDEPDIRDTQTRYTVLAGSDALLGRPQKCLVTQSQASSEGFISKKYPCITKKGEYEISNLKLLLISDHFPEFKYGDQISVSGKLDRVKNFKTDSGTEFDYVSYLAKDGIHFIMYHPALQKSGEDGGHTLVSFLYNLKNKFLEKISAVVPEPASAFLGGIIFGAKQSLGQDLLDDFKKAGLIHMVVLSGYNITIIAAGVFLAASYFGKRNLSFLISVIAIILFSIMVGLGSTVIRAAIMALIALLARFLGRPADALRWLFIAALVMLIWNPLSLVYDPSFQLSFMATLGLIIFSPVVESFISKNKIQRFIPVKFKIREIVSSTLAVQLFILPILIKMSGQVSLVSFIINPAVLPLVPSAMAAGALTGGLGLIPWAGKILSWPFGAASYLISQVIIGLTQLAAHIPWASVAFGSLPLWLLFLWYLAYGVLYWKINGSLKTKLTHV